MSSSKVTTGVLLINLGTPDSPATPDVRRYLREFLMDRRVIDIPFLQRFFLVNLIIAPFRAPQSAKIYQQVWTREGSPLKVYGEQVTNELQKLLGDDFAVVFGMRYQKPSIASALAKLKDRGLKRIIIVPLYPQYASATTGSTMEQLMRDIQSWEVIPTLTVVGPFLEHPGFIKAFVEQGKKYMAAASYDHYLFSYHGLPERQILRSSQDGYCQLNDKCCSVYHSKNRYCYRAQCFATTRLIARELGIPAEKYTVSFQSRLGKTPWIKPYTDELIPKLASQGNKNVLVFSPSFVADCLETTIEIGVEYKHLFEKHGGGRWQLVDSLNAEPTWVQALKTIITEHV